MEFHNDRNKASVVYAHFGFSHSTRQAGLLVAETLQMTKQSMAKYVQRCAFLVNVTVPRVTLTAIEYYTLFSLFM